MRKRTMKALSLVLALLLMLAVLVPAIPAAEAEDTATTAVAEKVSEIQPEAEPEDEQPIVKEEAELADTGAEADIAEEGAVTDLAGEGAQADLADVGATTTTNTLNSTHSITVASGDTVAYEFGVRRWNGYSYLTYMFQYQYSNYAVYEGTGSCSVSIVKNTNHSGKYTITGLNVGKRRIVCRTVYLENGKYFYHNITLNITVTGLATPRISSCESLDSGVKINWGAVPGAVKYRVCYKGANGWTRMYDTTNTYVINPSVNSGATYTFTVRCLNAAGNIFTSDFEPNGYRYTYNMATPRLTGIVSTSAGVKFTISAVPNAKKYRVFYKDGNNWRGLGDTTTTSFTHKDAVFGRTYLYTVRCLKSDGSKFLSAYNNTGWTHTNYLGTPSITGFTDSVSGTTVKWNAVSYAEKYRVFYKNGNTWTRLGDTKSTSFIDRTAPVGVTRTYTVRCLNNAANAFTSSYNNTGWNHMRYLGTPRITGFTNYSTGTRIKWGAITGAEKYRVYYKKNGSWTRLGDTTSTSFVHTDAKPGVTYTYTVRCINKEANRFTSSFYGTGWTHTYYRP